MGESDYMERECSVSIFNCRCCVMIDWTRSGNFWCQSRDRIFSKLDPYICATYWPAHPDDPHGDKSGLCNWILCLSVCLFSVLLKFSNLFILQERAPKAGPCPLSVICIDNAIKYLHVCIIDTYSMFSLVNLVCITEN